MQFLKHQDESHVSLRRSMKVELMFEGFHLLRRKRAKEQKTRRCCNEINLRYMKNLLFCAAQSSTWSLFSPRHHADWTHPTSMYLTWQITWDIWQIPGAQKCLTSPTLWSSAIKQIYCSTEQLTAICSHGDFQHITHAIYVMCAECWVGW